MQLVVVSDSHGRNEVFPKLRELYPNASAYLLLGDSETDEYSLDGFASVQGNNDAYGLFPPHLILDLDGVRIYMTHGDRIPRMGMIDRFLVKAKEENCQLFLFGHTHIYEVHQKDGVTILNPGSIQQNRDGSNPSYALVTLDHGSITVERKELPREHKPKKKGFWF